MADDTNPIPTYFIREYDLNDGRTLRINQLSVGDVGCVVWDAAIVLARYIETPDVAGQLDDRKVIELGSGTGFVGLVAACLGADVLVTDLPEFVPLMQKNIAENDDVINFRHTKIDDTVKCCAVKHEDAKNNTGNKNVENSDTTKIECSESHDIVTKRTYTQNNDVIKSRDYDTEMCDNIKIANTRNSDIIKCVCTDNRVKGESLVWGSEIGEHPQYDYILISDCIYYTESTGPLVKTLAALCHQQCQILMSYEKRLSADKPKLEATFFEMMEEHFEREDIGHERHDPLYSSDDIHIVRFYRKS